MYYTLPNGTHGLLRLVSKWTQFSKTKRSLFNYLTNSLIIHLFTICKNIKQLIIFSLICLVTIFLRGAPPCFLTLLVDRLDILNTGIACSKWSQTFHDYCSGCGTDGVVELAFVFKFSVAHLHCSFIGFYLDKSNTIFNTSILVGPGFLLAQGNMCQCQNI